MTICVLRSLTLLLCFILQATKLEALRRPGIAASWNSTILARTTAALANNWELTALLTTFAFAGLCIVAARQQGRARGLSLAIISIFGSGLTSLIAYEVEHWIGFFKVFVMGFY